MASSVKNITVMSSDGDEFKMTVGAAKQSELLKRMLEDCPIVVGKVPLYDVNTPTLVKIMEYCQKHADYEVAATVASKEAELKAWDAEFVKEEMDMVLNILVGASFLEIKSLIDLGYETMAEMIKEKSLEQIQQIFGIENNDDDEKQQEEIREQNQYQCPFDPNFVDLT